MLRSKDRGARVIQDAGKRKEHQSELTKKMNEEARVSWMFSVHVAVLTIG